MCALKGGRVTSSALFFLVSFLACLVLPQASQAVEDGYLAGLLERASKERIHEERPWLALLHYKPTLFGGQKSHIDDPEFFFSPEGRKDPEAEILSTLSAFFDDAPEGDAHPRCRFPARYRWLKGRLGIDESLLRPVECKEFGEFMEALNPTGAVLVFPESHINSPASMFGHTLIRIDSTFESKLVSYAVSYSAFTDESFGPMFAFKGIFGLYDGYFAIVPYYDKINDYSHMEHRDIWEYQLDLSRDEVVWMAEHVWELKEMASSYYFFDENCSYILLFLIEAARPSLDVTSGYFYWVVPSDTIREVKKKGLITETAYRPSKATRIRHIASLTAPPHRGLARALAFGTAAPEQVSADETMELEEKIRVLDLASEYLQYLYSKRKIEKEAYTARFLDTLGERSKLGPQGYDIPRPETPEEGHGSSRFALGWGASDSRAYAALRFRPSYHDVMDPSQGYTEGAAISFLDSEFRYTPKEDKFVLHEFTFIDISSIAPFDMFFKPLSWKARTGFEREKTSVDGHRTLYTIYTGAGYSFGSPGGWNVYGFLEPAFKAGGSLDKGYSAGGGASAGVLAPMTRALKAQVELRGLAYGLGDTHEDYSVRLAQGIRLTTNNSLRLSFIRRKLDGFYSTDLGMYWNYYF